MQVVTMNRKFSIGFVIGYVLATIVLAWMLNFLLQNPPIGGTFWLLLFGPSIFLLPMFSGATIDFIIMFGMYYFVASIVMILPVILLSKSFHFRILSIGIGCITWIVSGLLGSMFLLYGS